MPFSTPGRTGQCAGSLRPWPKRTRLGGLKWSRCSARGDRRLRKPRNSLVGREFYLGGGRIDRGAAALHAGGEVLGSLAKALSRQQRAESDARSSAAPQPVTKLTQVSALPYGVLLVAGDFTHQSNYAPLFAADGMPADRPHRPGRHQPASPSAQRTIRREPWHSVFPRSQASAGGRRRADRFDLRRTMRRGRIIVQAAQAGKHLYLDKPLAGSLGDADAIAASVRKAGVANHMFSLIHSDLADRVRADGIAPAGRSDRPAF